MEVSAQRKRVESEIDCNTKKFLMINNPDDTIIALATAPGIGAIAVIRISGKHAIEKCASVFYSKSGKQRLLQKKSHTAHFGTLQNGQSIIDEVLVSVFIAPNTFTGENTVEISCHGSPYIQQQIITLFLNHGCRAADPGEFTMRAFLNGKMDLSQAEAVADMIESDSHASHKIALEQMRGGFSNELQQLRDELIHFASLIELELDFSEEDVEFVNREQLKTFIKSLKKKVEQLVRSFQLGNVLKHGVSTVIAGKPNSGKSTLLNALLNEERALVSDIAGTTRDTIEEVLNISGVQFRFIDTAGIRQSQDSIEEMGVRKTFEKIKNAAIALLLFDVNIITAEDLEIQIAQLELNESTQLICVGNKIDLLKEKNVEELFKVRNPIFISSKNLLHIDKLKSKLFEAVVNEKSSGESTIVTNARHYQALQNALEALTKVDEGLHQPISGELLAADIRNTLYHIGLITGEVTTDDLLQSIFSRFCIGK